MDTLASSLDTRSRKDTHPQIIRLIDYVVGQMNEKTFFFLREICIHHAAALEKVITKCVQLKIQLKAADIDSVIESLYQQHTLPQNILHSIQYFLMDKRTSHFVQTLMSSTKTLDASLNHFNPLKPVLYVLNHLNIYIHSDSEKQFLSTLVSMMIHFQESDSSHSSQRQRSTKDVIKWMKSLLSISEKSDLSKLIELMSDRLQMIEVSLPGQVRNMDLLELYCMFEDLALQTEHFIPHDSNKPLLLDIHAMILLALASKKYPHAFFDIMYARQAQNEWDILNQIQSQLSRPSMLSAFFNSTQFNPYFRECSIRTQSNQQAFLSTALMCLKNIIQETHAYAEISLKPMVNFLKVAHSMSQDMENDTFLKWLQKELTQEDLFSSLQHALFIALEYEAQLINTRSGSLIFIANKLVSMGFSPKAVSANQTGLFQPLIASNALQMSQTNLQALKMFLSQLNYQQQHQLMTELCLIALIPYQMHVENQTPSKNKPLPKRTVDQHYPIPALHRIQKAKQARPTRVVRKQPIMPTIPIAFFEPLTNKIKSIKHTKYARH